MKVGLDISQTAFVGGVPTYTKMLAEGLEEEEQVEMTYFYSSLRIPFKGSLKNVKKFKLPPKIIQILFNQLRILPIEGFIGEVDIFHSSDWTQPPTKARKVTTYHDVIPLKYPQWSTPQIVEVHKRRLEIVEKEIDMVIAVSQTTKRDLMDVSNIPKEKIVVIYEGVDQKFFKKHSDSEVTNFKTKYDLPEKFVLSIGGIGERRNLKRVKDAAGDYKLIITGESLPKIPDEEMPLLYASARVLLYPSLYEGFGLPILESMASGTPVITSNLGSMAEIAGEDGQAAFLVDPTNIEEIRNKLDTLMLNDDIYKKIGQNGTKRASNFTWEKCVNQTVEVYKKIYNHV